MQVEWSQSAADDWPGSMGEWVGRRRRRRRGDCRVGGGGLCDVAGP